ncbi:MAG: hypothetical protein ACTSUO_08540 [Candidatus Thorarchaeota archaeon]
MQTLVERILPGSLILEETDRARLPEGVLCRVVYPICNIDKRNANNRVYERAVWEKVLDDEEIREKLKNRALFGQAEHPSETQSDLQLTSHVIFEMWIDEEKGQVFQKMDVLDTPAGRVIDTLLRAGCQVGVSTRAEGDLEEKEDDKGKFHRVIPESYKYITTDFTADPSTFGVVPQEIKRNIASDIKKELESVDLNKSERRFAQLILEGIQCKDSECVIENARKLAEEVRKEKMLLKDLIEQKLIKVDALVEFKDKKYKVAKIDEKFSSITIVPDAEGCDVQVKSDAVVVDGNSSVSVDKSNTNTIISIIKLEAEGEQPSEKQAAEEVGAQPEELGEPESPEGSELGQIEKGVPESKEAPLEVGDEVTYRGRIGKVVAKGGAEGSYKVHFEDTDEDEWVDLGEPESTESKVVEKIVKKKDGYYVQSRTGKNLGGPYSTRKEAEKRLKEVEMFKHMRKESKVNKDWEGKHIIVEGVEKETIYVHKLDGDVWGIFRVSWFENGGTYSRRIAVIRSKGEALQRGEKIAKEEGIEFEGVQEHPADRETKENKIGGKEHVVEMEETQEEILVKESSVDEGWEKLPRGWTKESLDSFARSLTKKTKGDPKGFVTACMKEMEGKVDNPAAFCASLKDRYLGTTKWRGKESNESRPVSDVTKEITDLKVKEASTRAERDKAIELLEKLEAEEKQLREACSTRVLEVKILSEKMKNLAIADGKVFEALRHKLEEKAAEVKRLNKQITEMKESHRREVDTLKQSVVSLKKKISEEVERAKEETKEEVTKDFVKQFVDFRLAESGLTVDSNSRALLESCETLDQVDDVFEEIRDIKRRSALHSEPLEKVTVKSTKLVDPEQASISKKVGLVFEGLGFKKRCEND